MDRCDSGHQVKSGHPCVRCRRVDTLAAIITADPSLDTETVTGVFDRVVTNGAVLRSLAEALATDPDILSVGAPPVVGRLVTELVAAGSTTFTVPTCGRCGRSDRPLFRSDRGGAACARCRSWQRAAPCAYCGATKPVAALTETGNPMCELCRRRRRGQRACGMCGETAPIAVRGGDDRPDVCVNCYRLPEAVCVRCKRRRPCTFADSHQPVCKGCAPRAVAVCAHCGQPRPPTARWPEGPVCEPCYRAALHRRGRCIGCDQTRRLLDPPGPDATRCADCAKGPTMLTGHVCGDCGIEDRLYERGRCASCSLRRRAAELLRGDQPQIPHELMPIHNAIVAAPQPYSALNWLRNGAGATILADIATGRLEITHQAFDAHPRPQAADYLRRMLVAHGLLPDRNEDLAHTERWVADLLSGIDRPPDRRLVTAYATWRVLRRLRNRADRNPGPWTATRHTRTQLAAAVNLLDWLSDRDLTLATVTQGDIDGWLATGPAAYVARDFLNWATDQGHCPQMTVPPPLHRTGTTMHPNDRWAILERLLHDHDLDLTDRVGGSLLLCYAQPLTRITALTVDQVTLGQVTTIRFGTDHIAVPEPLATLLNDHIHTRRSHIGVGSPLSSRWLFPGHLPGRPLTPSRLGERLGKLGIDARAGRRAALIQLAAQLPAAVLADLLNLSPGTAVGWVNNAGGDWSRYAASLAAQHDHKPGGIPATTNPT